MGLCVKINKHRYVFIDDVRIRALSNCTLHIVAPRKLKIQWGDNSELLTANEEKYFVSATDIICIDKATISVKKSVYLLIQHDNGAIDINEDNN